MARPRKEIDPKKVRQLTGYGLTVEEVAATLDCSKDTLERRFAADIKSGRTRLNASLKRKQVIVALRGSVPMLIWLGKQHLGQTERAEVQGDSLRDIADGIDLAFDDPQPEDSSSDGHDSA